MSDGTRLRQSWYNALSQSEDYFRTLLKSSASAEWKRIVTTLDSSSQRGKGKARASAAPELTDVIVHRRAPKSGDVVYRAVLDVSTGDEPALLDPWKSVLITPELRKEWDPAVEGAQLLEMLDPTTRVSKTNFTIGWPANPRDAVTISRTFNDATTLMDISTSLPRSLDEPAYLRPSPPYVRSNVKLFAWCIQHLQPSTQPAATAESAPAPGRLRITCFWQHDFKAMWNFGSASALSQQLAAMVLGLYKTVQNRGTHVPLLLGYGNGVSLERVRFDIDREALTVDYSIVPEEEDHGAHSIDNAQGLDLHSLKEHRRLLRSIECTLPASQGWDVQLTTKASSEKVERLPWNAQAIWDGPRKAAISQSPENEKFLFRVKHGSLPDDHSVLKVRVVIEISGPSPGLRLNGVPKSIDEIEERDPSSYFMSQQILQDATSTADLSFHTASTSSTAAGSVSSSSRTTTRPPLNRTPTERTAGAEKAILSQVRRKYIYFSSLLQEPEAKWKRTTEGRGVEVTQLDSIDPTLVVYRAEATFVGVGLWDLFGAIVTPGARVYWDKQHEDALLLEDVNELSELWHVKTKPAWPVNGRDSVLLRTVYKAPTTIHVFAFSADNLHLFPNVPPVDPNVIRTQVDLQGWSIEALSPTTTLVTLLEQSDPKGWSNKGSIPQQMITALTGVGEFAIKCGGPPAVTRLAGAKANEIRYDHERGNFRIEYEVSESRRTSSESNSGPNGNAPSTNVPLPVVECEIRCDMDTWASSLDIVVDPPPQSISCLRRHRLSTNGGGLWLTIFHDAVFASEERILVIIRKGPGKDKGVVMLNGAKANVDIEELPESEVKSLQKQKRVKPARIPLDQPPVMGVIRRRRAEWEGHVDVPSSQNGDSGDENQAPSPSSASFTSGPKFSSPLARFFTLAVEQATTTTQQAVAAMSPATLPGAQSMPSSSKSPMEHALEALSHVRSYYSTPSADGWTLVSEKGFPVYRKLIPEISTSIPVHKGEKVIEGVSAEEMAAVITSYGCRKQWDDRFDSAAVFEEYGARCHTAFLVTKGGFPFRDRGFYVASVLARSRPRAPISALSPRRNSGIETEQETPATVLCVTTSFSADSVASFSPAKYNPYNLPIGRFFIDAWILETLDPYTEENYAIPSTMCTRLVAADYAGSIPTAVNSMINGMLPRSILALETYMKGISPLPFTRMPRAGLFITDEKDDEPFKESSWAVMRRDRNRTLISAEYTPNELVHRSMITVLLSPLVSSSAGSISEDNTPRPSRISGSPLPEIKHSSHKSEDLTQSSATLRASTVAASSQDGLGSRETLRASNSAFNLRGTVKAPSDFILTEIVVDSKTYPEGYHVRLKSSIRDPKKKYVPRLLDNEVSLSQDEVVPVKTTVHVLPPSPLHSAGLNAERPPQHLVRLTIPTAQYQVSTIQDPLTGETRSAPPQPQWLLDLEEKGAVWIVEIRPAGASGKRDGMTVLVNDANVSIASEKESLTSLGRDELQNTRISKTIMLVRSPEAGDQIPEELRQPVAVSEHLYEAAILESLNTPEQSDGQTGEVSSMPEANQDTAGSANIPHGNPAPEGDTPLPAAGGGLLGFLNSYPNPLARFTSSASRASLPESPSSNLLSELPKCPPGGLAEVERPLALATLTSTAGRVYPLSTVLAVALIAFLLGSFLRSLLSPADFIYVVTDMKDVDESTVGWREIRRLLEIKYLIGGWDFQIAVVRRH
ncbi:hypothetical protein NEOLEDRAFT_1182062 [Neolentinus lepideus HHB14362 ss-1]|uniref:START domain-containing protein n=1 Tax=Neolentinus lepideus HHB14362 ss-1 TaxID=1314782 RepID=A0A165PFZ2_9AGAM|nr:hypothetical protein NEOLEDRAFT_1182062 [Neolentinus lepideus HHB14362 ss-1]